MFPDPTAPGIGFKEATVKSWGGDWELSSSLGEAILLGALLEVLSFGRGWHWHQKGVLSHWALGCMAETSSE